MQSIPGNVCLLDIKQSLSECSGLVERDDHVSARKITPTVKNARCLCFVTWKFFGKVHLLQNVQRFGVDLKYEVAFAGCIHFIFHHVHVDVRVVHRHFFPEISREETSKDTLARVGWDECPEFHMICLSMLQGIRITLAPYKVITVRHLTVLYVKAVQKRLTIEPVIVGGVTVLKSTGPIPNQGPVQPRGEVTFHVSADWLWAFFDRSEQGRLILSSGQDLKAR